MTQPLKNDLLKPISFNLNGKDVVLLADIRHSLLEILRDHGMTGAKEGCGVGECGACTVLVDGVPTNSCLTMGTWVEGKAVRTIEGEMKDGEVVIRAAGLCGCRSYPVWFLYAWFGDADYSLCGRAGS